VRWILSKRLSGYRERGLHKMATKFTISFHRNSENVHLKLIGDFDGSSAYDLLQALKKYGHDTSRVLIHTSSLKNIHPFGLSVFHDNLKVLGDRSLELVFTGEYGPCFVPEKHKALNLSIFAMALVA
jgi:anti-anti-sigma regulatory factor